MPMTIRPPLKASSAARRRRAASARVEVVGLGVEVFDRLGHDPRAGREDQLVVAERQAVGQRHDLSCLVEPGDLADHQRDPLVEQGALRPCEVGGPLAAHRDVHEPGLVDVLAGRVDDHDLDATQVDLAARACGRGGWR